MRGVLRLQAIALVALAGCGPIEYLNTTTFQAAHAVAEAKKVHADELQPYEYTRAVEYLHKSRELAGFARWQEAIAFGKEAGEMGRLAHEKAAQKGSKPAESVPGGKLE
ncbi:MAG TPA: hypothetical protein VFF06_10890 [Polyangia bacterium]|nr:hypothetical protein [Polyangia bacterium]